MFAAHFAEVEVNTRTGEVTVMRLLAAQDSGRVMNRLTFENQVQGGLVMGLGLGRTEERVLDRQTGKMGNANWHDYKIPTALDVPAEQKVHSVDLVDTECNTTGAKGVGEPATIPTAAGDRERRPRRGRRPRPRFPRHAAEARRAPRRAREEGVTRCFRASATSVPAPSPRP